MTPRRSCSITTSGSTGRGYPHGLAGAEIPIGSRIVAIADAYEAMISDRPYSAAMSHADALGELERQRGVQFDPDLVDTFIALVGDGTRPPVARPAVGGRRAGDATKPHQDVAYREGRERGEGRKRRQRLEPRQDVECRRGDQWDRQVDGSP